MSYIGNQPAESYSAFQKQDFTTSATTSYTLDHKVANENELALFINFVRQEAGTAYTASNNNLTLSSATSASDDMYCIYLGKAVQTVNPPSGSVGTSQLASTSVTAAKLNNDIISGTTALASEPDDTDEFLVSDAGTLKRIDYSLIKGGGITEADNWRLSGDQSGDADPISSNWERNDSTGFGYIGSGMTQSSGIFTFPSTGIYLVRFFQAWYTDGSGGNDTDLTGRISVTTNNSSYNLHAEGAARADNNFASSSCETFVDVTDTANVKVKFICTNMNTGAYLKGTSSRNRTHVTFIRLGDT